MSDTDKLYPHADMRAWLRTCEEEVLKPLEGKVTGEIPTWIKGTLLRNGPGANRIGDDRYNHVMDGCALIHRFYIENGKVTYTCRFLNSETYKKNRAANRIVVSEFGTNAAPDPCQTIFERFSIYFRPKEIITDNANISVYPFGDEVYVFSETAVGYLHRIDPVTLETLEPKKLNQTVLVHHSAHPHVMANGDVYNVGIYYMKGGLTHAIVRFPHKEEGDMFESAEIVGTWKPRWTLHPTYMHSFGITENYFVAIEHPMTISVVTSILFNFTGDTASSVLKTFPDYQTHIVLIHRETGVVKRYETDTIFFMHTINSYEKDGMLYLDLCSYDNGEVLNTMYVEAMENMQSSKEYARLFYTRPMRFEIPLDAPEMTKVESRILGDIGCDMPKINYEHYNGKPYKYFYGVVFDVNSELCRSLTKVDTKSGEVTTWSEPDSDPSEPIFIPRPDAKDEDDGVLLSVVLRGQIENFVQLIVLNAQTFKEIGRVSFKTPSPVPKCAHGWFLPETNKKEM